MDRGISMGDAFEFSAGDLLIHWIGNPFFLIGVVFQIWMFIHAVRNGEWLWAVLILCFSFVTALFYYFMVYRAAPSVTRGFELPGAHRRQRIKELQAQIHHLDKAHHHLQLGDIYFQQGKLDQAEASYRASLERDATDLDTFSHLGQCLSRQRQYDEAKTLLEKVVAEDPAHDYGHTLMALAEVLEAKGEPEKAIAMWKLVLEKHSYARARVQLASLYLNQKQPQLARPLLEEVLSDDRHAPGFQRKREKFWIKRARSMLSSLK